MNVSLARSHRATNIPHPSCRNPHLGPPDGYGVSVKVISEQLGHASIVFTLERYTHALPGIQDEAAARVERMLMGPPVRAGGAVPSHPDQSAQSVGMCAHPIGSIQCGNECVETVTAPKPYTEGV